MANPFSLRGRLDFNAHADLDDSLRAKKTFRKLGYYKTPSYGMTPYPDPPLFDAIRGFQSDYGLSRDGVMKPKGETARKLDSVLAGRTTKIRTPLRRRPVSLLEAPRRREKTPEPETPSEPNQPPNQPPERDGKSKPPGGQRPPKPEKPEKLDTNCRQLSVDIRNKRL